MKKKERLEFYKRLLEVVCKDPSVHRGLCHYIYEITEKKGSAITSTEMKRELPELWAKKPMRIMYFFQYWYPLTYKGWEQRIALLEEVIHELEYKVETEDYL